MTRLLRFSTLVPLGLLLVLPACGGGSPTDADGTGSTGTGSCTTLGQNTFVRDTLQDIYFWYRELPNLDPARSSSPEAYLEAVRYKPLDTSFSYITGKAADTAFYSDSQFIGYGISSVQTSATELRLAQVFPESPASEAGLQRGDYLLTINGRSVTDLIRTGETSSIFGANEIGVATEVTWRRRDGSEGRATMRKRLVTIPTVSDARVVAQGGQRVGYLQFRNFVTPSTAALNTAFATLKAAGANELVLDLRYNGGGLVSVAQHLGGLIGGVRTNNEVFVEYFHNDKNASRNTVARFPNPADSLDLSRLVVVATRASASASETIINSLRPFITVTVVGNTTYGKPVGQYGFDFCDKVLYPVAFQVRNALGQGDYFGGIPADCAAGDDLDHPLGDPGEASLAEGLSFLRNGRCTAAAASAARAHSQRESTIGRPAPRDGWQELLNAN
jgi:carboxyl-terminal processing protease